MQQRKIVSSWNVPKIFSLFFNFWTGKIKHKPNHFQIKTSRWSICKSCIGSKIWLILLRRINLVHSLISKVEFSKQFITLNTFYISCSLNINLVMITMIRAGYRTECWVVLEFGISIKDHHMNVYTKICTSPAVPSTLLLLTDFSLHKQQLAQYFLIEVFYSYYSFLYYHFLPNW